MIAIDLCTFDPGVAANSPAAFAAVVVDCVEESWDNGADLVLLPEFTWVGLEPLVEPEFHADSYGYRPGRSAHDALRVARQRVTPLFKGNSLNFHAMALGAPRWLGAITPIGGTLFLIGWGVLARAARDVDPPQA